MNKRLIVIFLFILAHASSVWPYVAVVPVKGIIDGGVDAFIERSILEAEENHADAIIFHIDTPGGRIDSAVHIKDMILGSKVTTIAFVDRNAISAGSLISIACDSLFMATGSSIGAATAVDLQGQKASEKVISYFRAQMRATAEAKGRRPDIAEAMVDESLVVEEISEKGQLLTFTYNEALEIKFADGLYESTNEIILHLGQDPSQTIEMSMNWAENVVRFLTHPIVSSLLMSIGFLGLLIEIRTPGWGIGGTIAIIALALFFGAHYIVRLATVGELLLFAVGIVLLTLEVFIIPGFGIAGISGIACIIISLYLSLVGTIPQPGDFTSAAYTVGSAFTISVLMGILLAKYLPRTVLFSRLTLKAVESASEGYSSIDVQNQLTGAKGITLSDLRPTGKAEIDGSRLDVVSEGGYIAKDTPVVVLEVKGSRIVVREDS